MDFIEIKCDDNPPAYLTIGWLTVCIPITLLITSCFCRSAAPGRKNRLSRIFFAACHLQFVGFVCLQMAALLFNVFFRFQREFAQMSVAHLAMFRVQMCHTLMAIALQLFITLVCGVGIALLLQRQPTSWKPMPSIVAMMLVAVAQVLSYWTFQIAMN